MQERHKLIPPNSTQQSQAENSRTEETEDNGSTGNIAALQENINQRKSNNNQKENDIKPRPKLLQARIAEAEKSGTAGMQAPIPRKRKLKFEDKYHRLTTFLENDLYDKVIELKAKGYIDSIVQLINDSIKLYLKL
jgi:hypothetical protein